MNYDEIEFRVKRFDKNSERMRHPKKKVVPSEEKQRGYRQRPDKRRLAEEQDGR